MTDPRILPPTPPASPAEPASNPALLHVPNQGQWTEDCSNRRSPHEAAPRLPSSRSPADVPDLLSWRQDTRPSPDRWDERLTQKRLQQEMDQVDQTLAWLELRE